MKITVIPYGPLSSNMYLIRSDAGNFIIDPSVFPNKLKKYDIPSTIDGFLITHVHFDHIYAINDWLKIYPGAPVYAPAGEFEAFKDPELNASSFFIEECTYDIELTDVMSLNRPNLQVLKTPGHSKDGVSFLFEDNEQLILFSGDTLFAGSCGRTDLPGGNREVLMSSLRLLGDLDPSTVVYPGHGPSTTIKDESRFNPFFNL